MDIFEQKSDTAYQRTEPNNGTDAEADATFERKGLLQVLRTRAEVKASTETSAF